MDVGMECVMSSRAVRRHHRDRLKARARKIFKSWFSSSYDPGWNKTLEYHVNVRWNNMQMCSCYSCGNPRRFCGRNDLTMQEKREYDRYCCDLEELTTNNE